MRTKPRKEFITEADLRAKGFEPYLPVVICQRICKGKKSGYKSPLIPCYIFVRNAGKNNINLHTIRGSIGMVQFDDKTACLSQAEIEIMKKLCMLEVPPEVVSEFYEGEMVMIGSGPLKGLNGIVCRNPKGNYIYIDTSIPGIRFKIDFSQNILLKKIKTS